MTSDAVNADTRAAQSVAIRWKRYLSDLAATQPPPPPAIVRMQRSPSAQSFDLVADRGAPTAWRQGFFFR